MANRGGTALRAPDDKGNPTAGVLPERPSRWELPLLFSLLCAGAAVRVYGAWIFRHSPTSDQGIVALMAKHIAEGKPFPTFFYGQPYMGSLEPAVSALFCSLFGYSGFSVCLGTAAVGFLLLPLVYLMARDIAGPPAGLAALAFCIVGPGGYFHYMHSPRGGYAVTLLFGIFLLWLGGRLATRQLLGERVRAAGFFLLGLVAGLGWWSNQLITAAILATGLLSLVVLRRRALGGNLLPAAGGFALGSWPFWAWNLRHDWASFAFIGSSMSASWHSGLRVMVLERLPSVFETGLREAPDAAGQLAGRLFGGYGTRISFAAYAVTASAALLWYLAKASRGRWTRQTVQMTGLVLFLLVFAMVFSVSSYAEFRSPRYLLPLVPAVGILVGVGSAQLARFLPPALASLPLLALLGWNAARVADVFGPMYREHETFRIEALKLGDDLRERGLGVMYTPYRFHSLNAALNEKFCFSELKGERYPPYALRAELSDEIAVLDDFQSVLEFVRAGGGSAEVSGNGRFTFVHGFKPPPEATREIPPSLWTQARDRDGGEVVSALTDGDRDSAWSARPAREGGPAVLEIALSAPAQISRVRLVPASRFPVRASWEIWGHESGPQGHWRLLVGKTPVTAYYWSGPRPYFGGAFFRLEARFAPAQVDAVRFLVHSESPSPLEVAEAQLFSPAEAEPDPEQQALPELLEMLGLQKTSLLYSDRWVSNAVRRTPGNTVATPEEKGIFMMGRSEDHLVTLAPATALLAREEDAGICRRSLARAGVVMRETGVGPWVLFDFAPRGTGAWLETYRTVDSLLWAGFSCLTRDPDRRVAASAQPD